MRPGEWKQQARVRHDRAPERLTKDTPKGTLLKGHWRFWRKMVDWYGRFWLEQWGTEPTPDFVRVLNLWNDSGRWTELNQVLEAMLLDRPARPPMLGEIEEFFRRNQQAISPKFDEAASQSYWWNYTISQVEGQTSVALDKFRLKLADFPSDVRAVMDPLVRELTQFGVAEDRKAPKERRRIEKSIDQRVELELKRFGKPKPCDPPAAGVK